MCESEGNTSSLIEHVAIGHPNALLMSLSGSPRSERDRQEVVVTEVNENGIWLEFEAAILQIFDALKKAVSRDATVDYPDWLPTYRTQVLLQSGRVGLVIGKSNAEGRGLTEREDPELT